MSNMIKAYTVRYEDASKLTIETHKKAIELDLQRSVLQKTAVGAEGFVEGLNAVIVDPIATPEMLEDKKDQILVSARQEADRIIEQAKKEAEKLKEEALSAAKKKGYEEGVQQVKQLEKKLKADYEEQADRQKKVYDDLIMNAQPQMAELIAELVGKITGIVVKDQEEVILYLIDKAIRNLDMSNEYIIRVSKEDYEYVSMRKDHLLAAIDREVSIYITEDINLIKNQCLIETDTRVMNCSLDIQLKNLITELRMISDI